MPTPGEDRLEAMSEALVRLLRRQDQLEARLRALESGTPLPFTVPPPIPAVETPAPILAQVSDPVGESALEPAHEPGADPAPPPVPQPVVGGPGLETQFGLNWVNRIAVITLIFGAAFFFKYAVDNDWIGPGLRVALGILCACVALFAGDRLWRREQKVFAQGIVGLGLSLLYLSFWAAASFYGLIPHAVAFLLMAATTVGAGWLACLYDSQAIAALGMLGGYLTPIALSTGENRPWILFSYVFLLNTGALVLVWMRKWPLLERLALVATLSLYGGWAEEYFDASGRTVATTFATLFYAQFALSEGLFTWGAVQILAPMAIAGIWQEPGKTLPWEILFAGGGLAVAGWRLWQQAPSWTLLCFWGSYWLAVSIASEPPRRGVMFAVLSAAFLMFFLWLPWWSLARNRAPRMGDLLVPAGNAAAYYAASYALLNPVRHEWMGMLAVSIGGLHLALAKSVWKPEAEGEDASRPGLLLAGIALSFATLAVPIQFSGFRITMAWALEGAALGWIASRFRKSIMLAASSVILALVIFRLWVFDSWILTDATTYSLLANRRFLTFAVSAGSLWFVARTVASRWTTPEMRQIAGAAYIAGHAVLLWALGLEIDGWVERSIPPENAANVLTLSISVLLGVYGAALVAFGAATRAAIHRILGLGLIGFVIVKLYLVDVWMLGRIFRITAFLALGVLLLAVSYLYSRFRPAIEKLWRPDSSA